MTELMFVGCCSFGDFRNQYKRRRNHMIRREHASGCFLALLGFLVVSPLLQAQEPQQPAVYEGPVGGLRIIEEGQPPVMIHATTEQMKQFREANPNARPGSVHAAATTNDLFYHGGTGGIGVETAPKIYLVLWGSQWNNNDPSGEAAILESFYRGVGGSSWLNSVTQYCQVVAVGSFAYTNLPYMTDAGASCGANFNGLGPDAGITIVGGHEMAETVTDQFPNTGWVDSAGAENGDKCAWISSGQGASADVSLSTGTFAVQSLWSNVFNGGSGGCV